MWYDMDPQAGHLPTLQCNELQQHYAIHFHCDIRNSFICLHICHRLRDIAHAQVNSCHPMSSYSVTSYCIMSLWYQYHFIFYHIRSYHIIHEDSFHIISTIKPIGRPFFHLFSNQLNSYTVYFWGEGLQWRTLTCQNMSDRFTSRFTRQSAMTRVHHPHLFTDGGGRQLLGDMSMGLWGLRLGDNCCIGHWWVGKKWWWWRCTTKRQKKEVNITLSWEQ